MAEVFGVVAGGVGLAGSIGQLAQAVTKLRGFCQRVKDAPSELEDLVGDLEMTTKMLENSTASGSLHTGLDPILLEQCAKRCRRAVNDIAPVADELWNDMSRRKLRTSFGMATRKEEMKRMLLRLDRCKRDLHSAHSLYASAQMRGALERSRAQGQHMMEQLGALTSVVQKQQTTIDRLHSGQFQMIQGWERGQRRLINLADAARSQLLHDLEIRRLQTVQEAVAFISSSSMLSGNDGLPSLIATKKHRGPMDHRMRTPLKLSMRTLRYLVRLFSNVWELSASHATYGWKVPLNCGRVIPNHDALWQSCLKGDIANVRSLLEDKKITIYDEDEDGSTLFTLAISWHRAELVRWLYDGGYASAASLTPGDIPPLYAVDRQLEASGCFVQKVAKKCSCQDEVTETLMDTWEKPMVSWSDDERFGAVWYAMFFDCDFDPVAEVMPHLGQGRPSYWNARGPSGASMVHLVARRWTLSLLTNPKSEHARHALKWSELLKDGVRSGADLHARWGFKNSKWRDHVTTPLVTLIALLVADSTVEPLDEDALTSHLQDWVSTLHDAGVDLEQYGSVESTHVGQMLRIMYHNCVACMTFGPSPKNWRLYVSHRGDLYAGIFWSMVEHPERAMPGAWVENGGLDLDAVKKEDCYTGQLRERRDRKRGQGPNKFSTSSWRRDANKEVDESGRRVFEDGRVPDDNAEKYADNDNYSSSHRPAYSYYHIDFDSKLIYFSLKTSKVSIRSAVLSS